MRRFVKASVLLTAGLAVIVALCLATTSPADEPPSKEEVARKIEEKARKKDAALKSAEAFLVLLDKGKYAESWESMCAEVRRTLPQRKWVDALNKTRKPFGRLRSRKLNRIEMKRTEDPKVYNQAWVYSDLESTEGFLNNELTIVFYEKGKEWRVSAYFIGDPELFPKPPVEEKADEGAAKKDADADEDEEGKPAEKKGTKPSKKK